MKRMAKRTPVWVLAGFLAATVSLADMKTYYALELKGGSSVYAIDRPVQKGKVMLFHRYPDGVYLSLSAAEVEKVSTVQGEPAPASSEKLAPGAMLYVGPALHGPSYEAPPSPPPSYAGGYVDYGYSGYGDSYYGGGYVPPLPGPRVPSRIGPNGYPIIAPPGTPGSVPPPIGPNGYPIISPPPVQVQPVTRRR
jgi:hypothetical protein